MELARRATICLLYKGIDITQYLDKKITSFSYTDCAKGEADTISISLEDSDNSFIKEKILEKYDRVTAAIKTINWNKFGVEETLNCGEFLIDEPNFSGPPDVVDIEAISKPSNTNFTETKKSKCWVGASIEEIIKTIANANSLDFFYDAPYIFIRNIEQNDDSDMNFISGLCENYGLAFKLTNNKIVVFDEKTYEAKNPICIIYKNNKETINYDFKSSLTNTAYDACTIKYLENGIYKKFMYSITDASSSSEAENKKYKIYHIEKVVNTYYEAEKLAIAKLRQLNKKATVGNITVFGNVKLLGGVNVYLSGFGRFDGKYFVDKTTHVLPGYNTTIEIHKCLEGY